MRTHAMARAHKDATSINILACMWWWCVCVNVWSRMRRHTCNPCSWSRASDTAAPCSSRARLHRWLARWTWYFQKETADSNHSSFWTQPALKELTSERHGIVLCSALSAPFPAYLSWQNKLFDVSLPAHLHMLYCHTCKQKHIVKWDDTVFACI